MTRHLRNDQDTHSPPLLVSDYDSGRVLRDRRAATLVRLLAQVPGQAIESAALTVHIHGLVCRVQGLHGFPGSIIVERRLWVRGQKRGLRPRLGRYAGVSGRCGW